MPNNFSQAKVNISIMFTFVLLCLSCRKNTDTSTLPHIVIPNTEISDRQDISRYFDVKTIRISGEEAYQLTGKVRQFTYYSGTLYLIDRQPTGLISAIDESGHIKWQLRANEEPVNSFSTLTGFFLDRKNEQIVIYDDQKQKVYRYDLNGEFEVVEELPNIYFNDIVELPGGDRLFSISDIINEFEPDNLKAALVAFSPENKTDIPDSTILNDHLYNPTIMPYLDYDDFFEGAQDQLFYHRNFDDTIFIVKGTQVLPYLTFSFSRNDHRKETLLNSTSELILQNMLDQSIPFTSFAVPSSGYFLVNYTYNMQESFAMIDMNDYSTIFNGNKYSCKGLNFDGRLDYDHGVLLNQMYSGNYDQLQPKATGSGSASASATGIVELDSELVCTLLFPK